MRILIVVLVGFLSFGALAPAGAPWTAGLAATGLTDLALAQPSDMNIDVDLNAGGAWYTSPVWLAIGIIAFVVLVLLIVMATRGGGTTVIKE